MVVQQMSFSSYVRRSSMLQGSTCSRFVVQTRGIALSNNQRNKQEATIVSAQRGITWSNNQRNMEEATTVAVQALPAQSTVEPVSTTIQATLKVLGKNKKTSS
jgi:hypothetical protein